MKTAVLAIGNRQIHQAIQSKITWVSVQGEVYRREDLVASVSTCQPDALIVAEVLDGREELPDVLIQLKKRYPKLRILYLAGNLDIENPLHRKRIQRLVHAGICDIHTMGHVSLSIFREFLGSEAGTINDLKDWLEEVVEEEPFFTPEPSPSPIPDTRSHPTSSSTPIFQPTTATSAPVFTPHQPTPHASAQMSVTQQKKSTVTPSSDFSPRVDPIYSAPISEYIPENLAKKFSDTLAQQINADTHNENIIPNLFIVSSIKPGTGKTMLSTNLAAAIAKYGRLNDKGQPPTVAIIEGDLQNLSVGTILGLIEDEYNLKTAIEKIDRILDKNNQHFDRDLHKNAPHLIEETDQFIKKCFKSYETLPNMKALVGSQFQPDELAKVTGEHYVYLLELITDMFDVVIVDTNSSLNHVTTYPVLQLANQCLYVLNLDFNNVHNNHRYRTKLIRLGIGDKIKYILNEDISQNKDNKEPLTFGPEQIEESGFRLEGCIPCIDKVIFLNRLHDGVPIVLDDSKLTLKARLEICKIADCIWSMTNLVDLQMEWERYEASQIQGRKKRFGLFS